MSTENKDTLAFSNIINILEKILDKHLEKVSFQNLAGLSELVYSAFIAKKDQFDKENKHSEQNLGSHTFHSFEADNYEIDQILEEIEQFDVIKLHNLKRITSMCNVCYSTTVLKIVDEDGKREVSETLFKSSHYSNLEHVNNLYNEWYGYYPRNGIQSSRGNNFGSRSTKSTSPVKSTKPKTKPDFKLNRESYVNVILSPELSARIAVMMDEKRRIEWGSYFIFDDYPSFEELLEKSSNNELIDLEVQDMVVIPQSPNASHIEYMDGELPELCRDYFNYQFDGKVEGRIHSHHNMKAYHSNTDMDQIKKYVKNGTSLFSTVLAMKADVTTPLISSKEFTDKIFDESFLGVPFPGKKEGKEAKIGYILGCNLVFSEYTQEDINKAREYLKQYDIVQKKVKDRLPIFNVLSDVYEKIDNEEHKRAIYDIAKDDVRFIKLFEAIDKTNRKKIRSTTTKSLSYQEKRKIKNKLNEIEKIIQNK